MAQDHRDRAIPAGPAHRRRILAGANRLPRAVHAEHVVGALLWASFFGYAAYSLGREFEVIEGPMVIVLGLARQSSSISSAAFCAPRGAACGRSRAHSAGPLSCLDGTPAANVSPTMKDATP